MMIGIAVMVLEIAVASRGDHGARGLVEDQRARLALIAANSADRE